MHKNYDRFVVVTCNMNMNMKMIYGAKLNNPYGISFITRLSLIQYFILVLGDGFLASFCEKWQRNIFLT